MLMIMANKNDKMMVDWENGMWLHIKQRCKIGEDGSYSALKMIKGGDGEMGLSENGVYPQL